MTLPELAVLGSLKVVSLMPLDDEEEGTGHRTHAVLLRYGG